MIFCTNETPVFFPRLVNIKSSWGVLLETVRVSSRQEEIDSLIVRVTIEFVPQRRRSASRAVRHRQQGGNRPTVPSTRIPVHRWKLNDAYLTACCCGIHTYGVGERPSRGFTKKRERVWSRNVVTVGVTHKGRPSGLCMCNTMRHLGLQVHNLGRGICSRRNWRVQILHCLSRFLRNWQAFLL